jgi:soluble lytic murein transglycosylase-like protein
MIAVCGATLANTEYDACFFEAAKRYQVNPLVLKAIAKTESTTLDQNAYNASNNNGSEDIGLMQVNSIHFEKLKEYQITREDLFKPCTSIMVGAWVLAQKIQKYGPTWKAVGAYNADSEDKRINYANKVYENYRRLLGQ